jgi:hypothetical protein
MVVTGRLVFAAREWGWRGVATSPRVCGEEVGTARCRHVTTSSRVGGERVVVVPASPRRHVISCWRRGSGGEASPCRSTGATGPRVWSEGGVRQCGEEPPQSCAWGRAVRRREWAGSAWRQWCTVRTQLHGLPVVSSLSWSKEGAHHAQHCALVLAWSRSAGKCAGGQSRTPRTLLHRLPVASLLSWRRGVWMGPGKEEGGVPRAC